MELFPGFIVSAFLCKMHFYSEKHIENIERWTLTRAIHKAQQSCISHFNASLGLPQHWEISFILYLGCYFSHHEEDQ